MQSETTFTISEVSQKTGVATVTLRAWERRYGLVKPKRTPKGHRLYTLDNIDEINHIVAWLNRGVAIRNIPVLLTQTDPLILTSKENDDWQSKQTDLSDAIIELNLRHANQLCDRINKSMPFHLLCEKLYQPVLLSLHQRWQQSFLGFQLEQQLWQQLWQRQITLMTLRAEKQKAFAKCWLVNCDEADYPSDYWLMYGLLIQAGIRVNSINAITDLTALSRLNDQQVPPLLLFGRKRLAPHLQNELSKLNKSWNNNVLCLGGMVDISPLFFKENAAFSQGEEVINPTDSNSIIQFLIQGNNN